MDLMQRHPDSDFANSIVPPGRLLIFLGYANGSPPGEPQIRAKDSTGEFFALTGVLPTPTTTPVETPTATPSETPTATPSETPSETPTATPVEPSTGTLPATPTGTPTA